jgi:uncharacterized membrane protein
MVQGAAGGQIRTVGGYIFVGIITIAPLWITWLILNFLLTQLASVGRPWVYGLARSLSPLHPQIVDWVLDERLQTVAAVIIVLMFLCGLGWATTHVLGRRLIGLFESLIERIPFVDMIYRSTKKFLTIASQTPEGEHRVVLIDFPTPGMKTIGFITARLRESATGQELASIYVPTAPNPTSGYIELVPMQDITYTDWTFDQAMAFVITGGTATPGTIRYARKPVK